MRRRIYICINGIMNFPGHAANWNGKAVTWIHLNTDARAEKVEYFCGPIGRAFGQKNRAEKLAATISYYRGWEIVLIGHSNGTDVILKALGLLNWPRIEALHLVSGACEADFNKNHLNTALLKDQVGRVTIYIGGKDSALRLAKCWLGRKIGYGVLGLHGPINVLPSVSDRVDQILWADRDHSDCFKPYDFDDTMGLFTLSRPPIAEENAA